MRITIQIQNVLLDRLTKARTDDGVVDFEECIDLSDQGCMEALEALQQLYRRKLERFDTQESRCNRAGSASTRTTAAGSNYSGEDHSPHSDSCLGRSISSATPTNYKQ